MCDNILGSADFLGLNYYYSGYAEPAVDAVLQNWVNPCYDRDKSITLTFDDAWPIASNEWIYSVPNGLTDLLKRIHLEYNGPTVMITENGWSDEGQLEDNGRVNYLIGHLQAVMDAIADGCQVVAYTHWSLLDNFEWRSGYT